MFAAGRGISHIIGTKPKKTAEKKKKKSELTLRQRLYVPCMWSSCCSCCSGLVLFLGGAVMSFMGYYAEVFATSFRSVTTYNETMEAYVVNQSLKYHISNFRFAGPLFMGVGTFLSIIACVVVLETRDKVLEMMEDRQWKNYKKRPNFYDLIVVEMKNKEIQKYKSTYGFLVVLWLESKLHLRLSLLLMHNFFQISARLCLFVC